MGLLMKGLHKAAVSTRSRHDRDGRRKVIGTKMLCQFFA
jgi:hypothetical protein